MGFARSRLLLLFHPRSKVEASISPAPPPLLSAVKQRSLSKTRVAPPSPFYFQAGGAAVDSSAAAAAASPSAGGAKLASEGGGGADSAGVPKVKDGEASPAKGSDKKEAPSATVAETTSSKDDKVRGEEKQAAGCDGGGMAVAWRWHGTLFPVFRSCFFARVVQVKFSTRSQRSKYQGHSFVLRGQLRNLPSNPLPLYFA